MNFKTLYGFVPVIEMMKNTIMLLLTFQSQNRTVPLQLFCLDCKIYEPGLIILQLQNGGHANPVCTNCCCMNLVRIPLLKVKLNEQ